MTETEQTPDTTDRTDYPLDEFERELSEKRLEATVDEAEIVGVRPVHTPKAHGDKALAVTFRTVAGTNVVEELPMPSVYDFGDSDLACLVEFTAATPTDLRSLEGQRVPADGELIRFDWMRQTLLSEEAAAQAWDYEKRLQKAINQGDSRC